MSDETVEPGAAARAYRAFDHLWCYGEGRQIETFSWPSPDAPQLEQDSAAREFFKIVANFVTHARELPSRQVLVEVARAQGALDRAAARGLGIESARAIDAAVLPAVAAFERYRDEVCSRAVGPLTHAAVLAQDAASLVPPDSVSSDPDPVPPLDDLVTLDQAAALVKVRKRTLERYKTKGKLPEPDIRGGGGKPNKWFWKNLRPVLAKEFRPDLPERFPDWQAGRS